MGVNLFNATTQMQKKILSSKINALWLYESSWFPWQPIIRVGSHVVFAWIHCTDVRIHCTDILIECR